MGRAGLVCLTVVAVGAGVVNLGIAASSLVERFGPDRSGAPAFDAGADGGPAAASSSARTGSRTSTSAAPAPIAASRSRSAAATPSGSATAHGAAQPSGDLDLGADPLLNSPMLGHPEFQAEVRRWVRIWATSSRSNLPAYLSRMAGFETMVDSVLAAHDLPWTLRYLPLIESGYKTTARSHAGAVGMWQFMAPTAGDMGVEVTRYVDDRRDPLESTVAAAEFLSFLHGEFGSWFLALAAYNAGPGRVRQIIQRHAPRAAWDDALYWRIRPYLPEETRQYVPNLYGAMIVAADPRGHGLDTPEPATFVFDRVPVRGRVRFETIARATGVGLDEIERLNPEYVRGETPAGRQVDLRLPAGSEAAFREYFSRSGQGDGGGR